VSRFYRELAADGATRADSLQRAQLELLRGRAHSHPVYWSAFVLIGSWL
jgi:CHAT domain-containing protein